MKKSKLPLKGKSLETLREELQRIHKEDWNYLDGRLPLHGYFANDAVSSIAAEAFLMFLNANALAPRAFPSTERMEKDVVEMALDLLNGDESSAGSITSGGTESIILAVKAARDCTRASRFLEKPNLVIPESAHPAFDKAAHLLDVDVVRIPVAPDYRCDVGEMIKHCNKDTFLLAASAPSLPYGSIDHIEALSEKANALGIWLHVDACIGGMLIPFVRKFKENFPAFDFSLRGVRSISTDLHKFGYTAKGASLILYRDKVDHEFQINKFSKWPKGEYTTPTLSGTRSGGPIASAWAVMNFLGNDGYSEITRKLLSLRDRYIQGLQELGDLEILGTPELTVLSVKSPSLPIFAISENMQKKGWYMSLIAEPPAIQQTISLAHEKSLDAYMADMKKSIEEVRRGEFSKNSLSQRVETY